MTPNFQKEKESKIGNARRRKGKQENSFQSLTQALSLSSLHLHCCILPLDLSASQRFPWSRKMNRLIAVGRGGGWVTSQVPRHELRRLSKPGRSFDQLKRFAG
jgi:hypothetical protein